MTNPRDAIPERLRRFLPAAPEPTPVERFDAWLDAPDDDAERWRVQGTSRPDRRTRFGILAALGIVAVPIVLVLWRALV